MTLGDEDRAAFSSVTLRPTEKGLVSRASAPGPSGIPKGARMFYMIYYFVAVNFINSLFHLSIFFQYLEVNNITSYRWSQGGDAKCGIGSGGRMDDKVSKGMYERREST